MTARIAAIQLNSQDNIEQNLVNIIQLVETAVSRGAELILLPENCVYMAAEQGATRDIAEPLGDGTIQQQLARLARQYEVWLIVGALATIDKAKVYQTSLVYDDTGTQVAYYHKRHLFNVTLPDEQESYRESDAFEYGDDIAVVDTPMGKVGLSICYDLRFPKHFQRLVQKDAEILTLPAAFTYRTGAAHWSVLLRARAIENQCYVLAAGQSGHHPGNRETWGHSMVIDPWGEVLDEVTSTTGIAIADIHLSTLHRQRQLFPTLAHSRD